MAPTRIPGRYLSHQEGLPKLPVPSLQQTCERYLAILEPIVDEEELSHTKELLAEFQKAGGVGERLQKGLERRARKTENWVSWLKSNPNPVLRYSDMIVWPYRPALLKGKTSNLVLLYKWPMVIVSETAIVKIKSNATFIYD